jgi:hypothetical protein
MHAVGMTSIITHPHTHLPERSRQVRVTSSGAGQGGAAVLDVGPNHLPRLLLLLLLLTMMMMMMMMTGWAKGLLVAVNVMTFPMPPA